MVGLALAVDLTTEVNAMMEALWLIEAKLTLLRLWTMEARLAGTAAEIQDGRRPVDSD